jgi:hypothetical protein
MSLKDWLSAARGLVGLIHEVRRLANAAERIADHLEGKRERGDPEIELIHTDEAELSRIYEAQQRFGSSEDDAQ